MSTFAFTKSPGEFAGRHPLAADVIIPQGGLVALDASGNLNPATSALTGSVIGRAAEAVDNTDGAAGDLDCLVERGIFVLPLAASNPPTKAHVLKTVFSIASDTVANTGTCRAGILLGFDPDGNAIVDTRRASEYTAADVV